MNIKVAGMRGVLDVITKIVVARPGVDSKEPVSIGIEVHQANFPSPSLIPRSNPRDEIPFPNGKQVLSVAEFIVYSHATQRRTRRYLVSRNRLYN